MKLHELVNKCGFEIITELYEPDREISDGYSGDLLSDVIANTKKDNIWITMQTHLNIIAVASLKKLTAIIVVMNRKIGDDTIGKAKEEKVTILRTDKDSFKISGMIYGIGVI
jgi:hypothetical protein